MITGPWADPWEIDELYRPQGLHQALRPVRSMLREVVEG